ncbi:MAG TPA: hypothetical protein VOA41_10575 [Candidatus Dormibacteraeota bacterium]|nr:hypothetical protein [Candidatus Dormibacteraeota bacterium]
MKGFNKTEFRSFSLRFFLLKMLLLGLVTVGGAASPLCAQTSAQGKFTLPFAAHWGNKLLPAGAYTYSIEPIGSSVQNVSSIRSGYHPVLLVVRSESGGPATLMIALASSQEGHAAVASGLVIETTADGPTVRTLCLENFGLVVDFQAPKAKKVMYARGTVPGPSATTSKAIN